MKRTEPKIDMTFIISKNLKEKFLLKIDYYNISRMEIKEKLKSVERLNLDENTLNIIVYKKITESFKRGKIRLNENHDIEFKS